MELKNNAGLTPSVSRVFRLGKITVGEGFVQYENRTAFGRVKIDKDTELRYRRFLKEWRDGMFQGNRQGGGGDSEFVNLTGLFASKSGKSIVGSIKPEAFNTLFQVMQECHQKGTELVFVVSGPGKNVGPESSMKARLSVTVGRPARDAASKAAPAGPFGTLTAPVAAPAQSVAPAAASSPFGVSGGTGKAAVMPPKDELNDFLESFSN